MGERSPGVVEVAVHTFGMLRMRTGQARIDVRLASGTTVEGLLRHLAEDQDEGFLDVVVRPPGERQISTLILNGRTLQLPRDLQHQLSTGDQLYLIPPIAGG
ncbi:MAG: MoaD/ThiS family protein [Anaerolineae bacterium]|jgi:molybdopterin converting factor small subunit